MRWIWIDRIIELVPGEKLVAVKNITAGEDVLHDHFVEGGEGEPTFTERGLRGKTSRGVSMVMPHTLIIEGMAQTAGILVGHTGDFKEKVILAKINRATFDLALPPKPGYTLRHTATLDRFDTSGASTHGVTERIDSATGETHPLATIDLMFSHIDQNRSGLKFPEHNFVFTSQFMKLLEDIGE